MTQDLLPLLRSPPLATRVSDAVLDGLTNPHRPARRRCLLSLVLLSVPTFVVYLALSVSLSPAQVSPPPESTSITHENLDDVRTRVSQWIAQKPRSAYAPLADVDIDVPISAIVVHNTMAHTRLHVEYLSHFPFITEIIVWNDDPRVDLVHDALSSSLSSSNFSSSYASTPLRIYNSPASVGSLAVHYACLLARGGGGRGRRDASADCYVPSRDGLNAVLDASYTHYISSCVSNRPRRGVDSDPSPAPAPAPAPDAAGPGRQRERMLRVVEHGQGEDEWWTRRVVDRALGLYTLADAFSPDRGGGTFFPRRFSKTFLDQVSYWTSLPASVTKSSRWGDLSLTRREWIEFGGTAYFDVWTNQIPEVWTVPRGGVVDMSSDRDDRNGAFGDGASTTMDLFHDKTDPHVLQALRILACALTISSSDDEPSVSSSNRSPLSLSSLPSPFLDYDDLIPQTGSSSSSSLLSSPHRLRRRPRPPPPESHARAPCINDECIFFTSLAPYSSSTLSLSREEEEVVEEEEEPLQEDEESRMNLSQREFDETIIGTLKYGRQRGARGGGRGTLAATTSSVAAFAVDRDDDDDQRNTFGGGRGRERGGGIKTCFKPPPRRRRRRRTVQVHKKKNRDGLMTSDKGEGKDRNDDEDEMDYKYEGGGGTHHRIGGGGGGEGASREDYYGLEFIGNRDESPRAGAGNEGKGGGRGRGGGSRQRTRGGRLVRTVQVIGSKGLGGVVSWDRADDVLLDDRGGRGWVVYTERKRGGGGWEPRQLVGGTSTTERFAREDGEGDLYKTRFELVPIETRTTFTDDPARGTYEVMEDGEIEIAKIKLVRIQAKVATPGTRGGDKDDDDDDFVLCGWNIDGWEL